VAITVKTAITC